jgi:hypothetical protein
MSSGWKKNTGAEETREERGKGNKGISTEDRLRMNSFTLILH